MADITLTCDSCSTVTTVSEFVDPEFVTCHKCGAKLHKPDTADFSKPKPTVRTLRIPQEPAASDEAPPEEWRFAKHLNASRKETGTGKSTLFSAHHMLSWLIFLIIGGLTGAARYGGFLTPDYIEMFKVYGPFVAAALHLVIVLVAFKYSIYSGTFSLLIPPYAYYFLFTICDEFYLRAVVAGFLVGIGQDSFIFYQGQAADIYTSVTKWIASGG